MTVENNDPKLVDHEKYGTPIYLLVDSHEQRKVGVKVERVTGRQETVHVESK
jgi:hypothetical protein